MQGARPAGMAKAPAFALVQCVEDAWQQTRRYAATLSSLPETSPLLEEVSGHRRRRKRRIIRSRDFEGAEGSFRQAP